MEHKKSYIGIKNSVEDSTLELYFTDFIFDGFDWDTWETTNLVQDTIDKIKAANPSRILVTVNSLGGDVMIGLAIYNFLKNYKAKVEVEIIGFAASIASVIAMSASKGKLRMAKNGFMIIHAASSYAFGNAKEMREQAEVLDKISAELADIYALRSGKEASYFTNLWSDGGDVWLTAQEAKDLGLADELMNAVPMTAKMNPEAFGFKNVPQQITTSIIQNQKLNMAFTKTLATVKAESFAVVDGGFLLEEAQLNQIEAAIEAAETNHSSLAVAIQDLSALKESSAAEITALKATAEAEKKNNTEKDTKIASQAEKIKELEAKVAALGKEPSGKGSNVSVKSDTETGAQEKPLTINDPDHPLNVYAKSRLPKKS